jgi:RecA/RadA recombinase
MSKLLEKMQKAGSIKHSHILSESTFFNVKDDIPTTVPIINLALSGLPNGGLSSGLTFVAGPSRNFKSLLGLVLIKAYMDKYPDAICLFYDSEFGITPDYIESNGIDTNRVLHIPLEHLEQLKFDMTKRLEQVERGEKVVIFIDSVGNLASKKELEDSLNEKSVADMTRAKVMKSLWRIVTPSLTSKDIPCIAVNHTYETMEMYSKSVMSGGTGGMYSANQVFIISKSQEKEKENGKDALVGYNFTINIEKSRYVREKSKFKFTVKFEGGIDKWSGLMDIALEAGLVVKPKMGWYAKVDPETGEVDTQNHRLKQTNTSEFWTPILESEKFAEYCRVRYQLGTGTMIASETEEVDDEYQEVLDTIGD